MKKSVLQNIKSAFNLSYLALIVLFCFAISTSFMSINYVAKYLSTDGGFDGARVANFIIDVTSNSDNNLNIDIARGQTSAEYKFIVSNSKGDDVSEISQQYDVVMVLNENLPEGITVTLDGKTAASVENGTYTFDEVDDLMANNENENEHTLLFSAENISENYSIGNIEIKVYSEQVD